MNLRSVRKYSSPLRQSQVEATRERILSAVARLFENCPEEALSFEAVAAEAGLQRRTIFRHFPSKDALLAAFWMWLNQQISLRSWPESEDDLRTMPIETFSGFERHRGIVQAALTSRSGREMLLRAVPERQAAFRKSLAAATKTLIPQPSSAQRRSSSCSSAPPPGTR